MNVQRPAGFQNPSKSYDSPLSDSRESLDRLKQTELNLLSKFIECCQNMQLPYFLMDGSMLGAVRHQGFIPWDDDIDVGMFRADYETFLAKAQELLPSYCFVQCLETEPDYPYNFAKIRDSRTTFIETSVKNCRINHGVFIDLFPLDYYPVSRTEQKEFDRKNRLLSLRIRDAFTLPEENRHSPIAEAGAKSVSKVLCLKYPTVRAALEAREALFKSVSKSTLVANHCSAWGKKETVPAEWYGEGTSAVFEGLTVQIPASYDKWLSQVYGDYMQLPPIEKRVTHHFTERIDMERPYTFYR